MTFSGLTRRDEALQKLVETKQHAQSELASGLVHVSMQYVCVHKRAAFLFRGLTASHVHSHVMRIIQPPSPSLSISISLSPSRFSHTRARDRALTHALPPCLFLALSLLSRSLTLALFEMIILRITCSGAHAASSCARHLPSSTSCRACCMSHSNRLAFAS